jgi:(S)-ureidoglycine aminohydrolase
MNFSHGLLLENSRLRGFIGVWVHIAGVCPMPLRQYQGPPGGLPPQTQLLTDRAVFTDAYAVIPRGCMTDIVTSMLPYWEKSRFWVIARPLSGFAETFSQYIGEVAPGGGSDRPETDASAQSGILVMQGSLTITIDGTAHQVKPGGFVYIPAGMGWTLHNEGDATAQFNWIRKKYQPVEGLGAPEPFAVNENQIAPNEMVDTNGAWATTRFMDHDDIRHDMHITIVTLQPGAVIPFAETHVMEHGLYVLEGKAVYHLNQDWVEVEAGDFMWLRAFCP